MATDERQLDQVRRLHNNGGRRILAYDWMERRYTQLLELWGDGKGVDWTAQARLLCQFGVRRKSNAPMHPDSLRNTWRRLRTHKRKFENVRRGSSAPLPEIIHDGMDDPLEAIRREMNERSGRTEFVS